MRTRSGSLSKRGLRTPGKRPGLTTRETSIVAALLKGATNKDIARLLGLREQTVKNRLWKLYRKAGVANRLQLVMHLVAEYSGGPFGPIGI